MCRLKTYVFILILFLLPPNLLANVDEFVLQGHQFSPFSRNVCRSGELEARLLSLGSSAYAIYEFKVPHHLKSFGAWASIRNPRQREVDIYVWNYGSRIESPVLSKEDIDPHWIRWESLLIDGQWHSRSPEFLSARLGSGILDFLGQYGLIKLMFYADKGFPPDSDELFFIRQVKLLVSPRDEILDRIEQFGKDVWIEGNLLVASGIGYPPKVEVSRAPKRVMAQRAALVSAYRNLALVMGEVEENLSSRRIKELIKGARERSVEDLPDGGVKVVVEMPLEEAMKRNQ